MLILDQQKREQHYQRQKDKPWFLFRYLCYQYIPGKFTTCART